MSARVIKLDDPLVCPHCGSADVMRKEWINPNTGVKLQEEEPEDWCDSCGKEINFLIRKEEYDERNAQLEEGQLA